MPFRIKGYEPGANITIINAIYHKSQRDGEGGWTNDSIDIVFKDLDTGQKKVQHIVSPNYTYYMANANVRVPTPQLCIEKEKVHPVECKYRDLKKDIAAKTDNLNFFFDNLKSGNYKENDKLFTIPTIFNADMHIEDYYRMEFDRLYRNEPYEPDVVFFDIEADIVNMRGTFPEPGECPVNAVTLIDTKNKKVYVLLLDDEDNFQIHPFIETPGITDELKAFVRENVGGWKKELEYGLDQYEYSIMLYEDEIKLITDLFKVINTIKPEFAVAWNIAFDLPYLIERIKILGYDPCEIICHPDFRTQECWYYIDKRAQKFEERGDYGQVSSYTVYIDQLILFASRRKGQKKGGITSFKLDFIGDVVAGVRKLDYSHITDDIAKLPRLSYKTFAFYNVCDTIVQLCIDKKVGDLSFLFSKALATNTRFAKVHRQTTYLVNRGIKDFWEMQPQGYVMGNNINKNNGKVGFAGAYVANPIFVSAKPKRKLNGRPINILDNLDDFDYRALYPNIIDESNMSPATQLGKILLPNKLDSKEDRFNNPYFNRSVWFIEDLVSHNRLDFCNRYLNLPTYEEMYNSIIDYFTKIKNPMKGLYYSNRNGKKIMCININNKQKRTMCHIVDNTKKRNMCVKVDKMPSTEVMSWS